MAKRQPEVHDVTAKEQQVHADKPAAAPRKLSPEAERALAEAEQRRRERDAAAKRAPAEHGGRQGPDPARYGDWEKDGIASDF
jgi:hypothetical protein